MLLATLLLIAASSVLGHAVATLCGWPGWRWWSPALGYGVLMIVFGQVPDFPSHQHQITYLAIAAVVASCALFALPSVRGGLRDGVWIDWLVIGIGVTLLAAIPFFAFGYAGILGPSVSNDMSQHLSTAYWLNHRQGFLPVAAIGGNLINTGYPLGPHALAAALGHDLGLGEVRGFSALTLAVPALTAFAVLGLVPEARRGARWALAGAIGLGYLPVAFLAQGQFKETILAMLVLASAVWLCDLASSPERAGWRRGAPFGLFVGAAIYTYSYGGVLWIAAITFFFLAAEVIRRRALFAIVAQWWRAAITAAAVLALVALPELDRIRAFRKSIFGQESLQNTGNLAHKLNPLETLGVWFNGDFRFNAEPRWPTILFCALALIVLAGSFAWWWRRRIIVLPAAILAGIFVWVQLTLTVNIYNQAKGLIMLAPLVMACLGAPLAAAWTGRAPGRSLWLVRGAGVVLLAGVAISSFGVLRSAPVGLGSHDQEFAQIRPIVAGKPTLFIDNDHFGEWELRTAKPLYTTNALYAPAQLGQHPVKQGGLPLDADNYGAPEFDKVDYAVISNGRYTSQMPSNMRVALRTPSYVVYRRVGATPDRQPLEMPGQPGAVFDCSSPQGRDYLKRLKWAGVLPRPVVSTDWSGSIAKPGQTARMTAKLPRGRWDISLQYLSTTPLTLKGPGVEKRLAQNFGLITSFWNGGTLTSNGSPSTITLTSDKRTSFANLLGSPRKMRAPLSPGDRPLFQVAFTRHGRKPRRVPVAQACGRYVDWFAPAGSAMR
jgi:hypothetical protein